MPTIASINPITLNEECLLLLLNISPPTLNNKIVYYILFINIKNVTKVIKLP